MTTSAIPPWLDELLCPPQLLEHWPASEGQQLAIFAARARKRLEGHGALERTLRALENLRKSGQSGNCEAELEALGPWKKGPLPLFGVEIDAEWDCRKKWLRLAELGVDLRGHRVLDVGCGNGYYFQHWSQSGACAVLGVDPALPSVGQFAASQLAHYQVTHGLLALPFEEMVYESPLRFETVVSMGVLYHRRSPIDHLTQLRQCCAPGGQLILETLTIDTPSELSLTPSGRYAGMRNVWFIPSPATLTGWLKRAGFELRAMGAPATTTSSEQRATKWAPGPSLALALDPAEPGRTVEGHPAPVRVIAIATATRPSG